MFGNDEEEEFMEELHNVDEMEAQLGDEALGDGVFNVNELQNKGDAS
jgi:hypothetical protein